MLNRTVCSAFSYVVALTIALPGLAAATPADVSGANLPEVPQLALKANSGHPSISPSPVLHIEELNARRLSGVAEQRLAVTNYDQQYLADFQESLTQKISAELETRIKSTPW